GSQYNKKFVTFKLLEVKSEIDKAKAAQQDLSLKSLSDTATKFKNAADGFAKLAKAADEASGDQQTKARNALYKDASPTLTDVTRELTDWTAQVTASKLWLATNFSKFNAELTKLGQIEGAIAKVVEGCLPKLTARLPNPDGSEKPVDGGTVKVPEIKDPKKALADCGNNWVAAKQTYGAVKTEM